MFFYAAGVTGASGSIFEEKSLVNSLGLEKIGLKIKVPLIECLPYQKHYCKLI